MGKRLPIFIQNKSDQNEFVKNAQIVAKPIFFVKITSDNFTRKKVAHKLGLLL
jgi:hypothetical protein